MFKNHFKLIFYNLFIILFSFNLANSEIIKEIRVVGNDRISDQTIISFSNVLINESIDQENMNRMLKDLYDTNFFKNISISIDNNVLTIKVDENPIINKIIFDGIKSNKIKKIISDSVTLKSRSSYNEFILNNDKQKLKKF